jgi:hypothetical protein
MDRATNAITAPPMKYNTMLFPQVLTRFANGVDVFAGIGVDVSLGLGVEVGVEAGDGFREGAGVNIGVGDGLSLLST